MPKITGSVAIVRLALDALLKDIDNQCRDILLAGTTEWVRTVVAIVPNWSGMSRASLRPIADKVGVSLFASPVASAPNRVAEGEAKGEATLHPIDTGRRDFRYFFEWRSSVFHFVYNEFNDANLVGFHLRNPGPYHSMRQAEQSFFRTVNPRLRNLQIRLGAHVRVIRRRIG